jgi:hypothetical protein
MQDRRVKVYRNLTKHCYSVMHQGLVMLHTNGIYLMDAKFVVRPAGNARVRATGRKNVHAFIVAQDHVSYIGESLRKLPEMANRYKPGHWQRVSYNPYTMTNFQTQDGQAVKGAAYVIAREDGVYACGVY